MNSLSRSVQGPITLPPRSVQGPVIWPATASDSGTWPAGVQSTVAVTVTSQDQDATSTMRGLIVLALAAVVTAELARWAVGGLVGAHRCSFYYLIALFHSFPLISFSLFRTSSFTASLFRGYSHGCSFRVQFSYFTNFLCFLFPFFLSLSYCLLFPIIFIAKVTVTVCWAIGFSNCCLAWILMVVLVTVTWFCLVTMEYLFLVIYSVIAVNTKRADIRRGLRWAE